MHRLLQIKDRETDLALGNDAIVRGALEAGLAFASCYPGTPSSEIGNNLYIISKETDVYFEFSVNEKVALEVAASAAQCGLRSMCSMKHVGLNVASDVLITLAYIGVEGGLVVVSADDPSLHSSQNEQDNRYYAKLGGLPMLEPADPGEAYLMTREAFEISERYRVPVILRTTTRVNHSRSPVTFGPLAAPKTKGEFKKNPFRLVPIPAVARELHKELLGKRKDMAEDAARSPFNTISGEGTVGVASSGVARHYVADGLRELGIMDRARVLNLGFSHPFPHKLAKEFLASVNTVLVVEELEPILEESLKVVALHEALSICIEGKPPGPIPRHFELDPITVKDALASHFGVEFSRPQTVRVDDLPPRPPNLCPGCPHRATYYSIKKVFGDHALYPSDIGCYTLGILPPLSAADYLLCMGSSIGTGCGFSEVQERPVVSFIGDSTFFHSGIAGLVNAKFNNHDTVLVILDNFTTAMTGHQPHPGTSLMPEGEVEPAVSIEGLVEGIGIEEVAVINPLNLKKSIKALEKIASSKAKGPKVVVARAVCPLYHRAVTGKRKPIVFQVQDSCDMCRDCIDDLACPAFSLTNGRIEIDERLCNACAVCSQICDSIKPKKVAG